MSSLGALHEDCAAFKYNIQVSDAHGDLDFINGSYGPKGMYGDFPKFVHQGNSDSIIFCSEGPVDGKVSWKLNVVDRTDSYVFVSDPIDPCGAEDAISDTSGAVQWKHLYIRGRTIDILAKDPDATGPDFEANKKTVQARLNKKGARQSVVGTSMEESTVDYLLEVLKAAVPKLRIAVIGGGIYGCHNALMLAKNGFEVTLYEKEDHLFAGASGHCAFRIHKGYHYPRSQKTRALCTSDHEKFMDSYGHLTQDKNIEKTFLISQDGRSNIDLGTMKHVMNGAQLSMVPIDAEKEGFANVEGGFIGTGEPLLFADYPRIWFMQELKKFGVDVQLSTKIEKIGTGSSSCIHAPSVPAMEVNGKEYDFAVNCTYNQTFPSTLNDYEFWYEVCAFPVAVLKEGQEPLSFGVFDGPFPSIEPYEFKEALPERFKEFEGRQLYQIWHVKNIVWKRFQKADDAWALVKSGDLTADQYFGSDIYENTMSEVRKFYPNFDEKYEIVRHNTGIKTMVTSASSSRPLIVVNDVDIHPFFITVFSAKLSTVFSCAEALLSGMVGSVMKNNPEGEAILDKIADVPNPSPHRSTLRISLRESFRKNMRASRYSTVAPMSTLGSVPERSLHRAGSSLSGSKNIVLAAFEEDKFHIFDE